MLELRCKRKYLFKNWAIKRLKTLPICFRVACVSFPSPHLPSPPIPPPPLHLSHTRKTTSGAISSAFELQKANNLRPCLKILTAIITWDARVAAYVVNWGPFILLNVCCDWLVSVVIECHFLFLFYFANRSTHTVIAY